MVEEDSMTGRDLSSPIPVTCSGRHGLVQTQDTSTQTDAQTDELEGVRDSVVRFSQQLQATQELLDHKEVCVCKTTIISLCSVVDYMIPTSWQHADCIIEQSFLAVGPCFMPIKIILYSASTLISLIDHITVHAQNALEKREWTITELRRQLENQQEMVEQQATNICKLRADIRHKSIELNEVSIQKLQAAISEKDTSMALLELQGSVGMSHSPQVQVLTQERIRLMKELKSKVNGLASPLGGVH